MNNVFKHSAISKSDDDKVEEKLRDYISKRYPILEFIKSRKSYSIMRFEFRITDPDVKDSVWKELSSRIEILLDAFNVAITREGSTLVIIVPRKDKDILYLGEGFSEYINSPKLPIRCYFGERSDGIPAEINFTDTPHALMAAMTGAGKTTLLSNILLTMCSKYSPDELNIYIMDPKRELSMYQQLPQVKMVVYEKNGYKELVYKLEKELDWRVDEIVPEYLNIENYNNRSGKNAKYILFIADEAQDIIQRNGPLGATGDAVRMFLKRYVAKGRSIGMFSVTCTQRASKLNVDTEIKTNIETRIALKVSSSMDSRMVLDEKGAENMIGNGDGIIKSKCPSTRFQSAYNDLDERLAGIQEIIKTYGEAV